MIWWKNNGMNKPIIAKDGAVWNFLVGHDFINGNYSQHIFFWSDKKDITGIIEIVHPNTIHRNKIKDRMIKIANDKEYRDKFIKKIDFPLKKNY
jgi:hypothetical protein